MLRVLHWVSAASLSSPSFAMISPLATAHPSRIPGARRLGEAPEVDDPALGVEALERRQGLALEAEVPVRRVLHDQEVEPVRQLHEPPPTIEGERHARRVLEVRHRVQEPCPWRPLQHALQVVDVHAAPHRRGRGRRRAHRG